MAPTRRAIVDTAGVADRRMPPRKRSAAQLAAAARGTATSKARKLDSMLSAVASLPDDEAIENMTADVVDDLLKRDVDTIDWHQYIKNYIAKGDPVFFCTFTAEDCENVD